MAKKGLTKYYSLKSLKESLIIVVLSAVLILLTIKFGASPIASLLKSLGANIIIILVCIFLISYGITYGVNYAYSQMDIKSKKELKK